MGMEGKPGRSDVDDVVFDILLPLLGRIPFLGQRLSDVIGIFAVFPLKCGRDLFEIIARFIIEAMMTIERIKDCQLILS